MLRRPPRTPRPLATAALVVALSAAGCAASPGTHRATSLDQLHLTMSGELARAVQHDAPEAYAEAARAMQAAEAAASGPADELERRVAEAQLTLAWAATQARAARARARVEDAEHRRAEADADATRMEQQAATLTAEAEARLRNAQSLSRARAQSNAPRAVPQAERATAAAELRQQTELALAAAALLGADEATRAPVVALLHQAEEAGRGADATAALLAAGRAFEAAEALLRTTRAARPPGNAGAADPAEGEQLVSALSEAGGLEPRRDERGVVAVVRGAVGPNNALAPAAAPRAQMLARVIQSHPNAAVRVEAFVGGADRPRAERSAQAQAAVLADALVHAGVPQARVQAAGVYRIPGGARSTDQVEVVLVLPAEP